MRVGFLGDGGSGTLPEAKIEFVDVVNSWLMGSVGSERVGPFES